MATLHPFPGNAPLPNNPYDSASDPTRHEAYQQCLDNESDAGIDADALLHARCLGYMLRELTEEASFVVAHEIIACNGNDSTFNDLGKMYILHLIRLFKKSKGRTPIPSEHPSRPSFEEHHNFFIGAMPPAPVNHQAAKTAALVRDRYRCVVCDSVDLASFRAMGAADRIAYNVQPAHDVLTTNFCHIFPPSTTWSYTNDPTQKTEKYAGMVWAIVDSIREIDVLRELSGANIHKLTNGLTMAEPLRDLFDNLDLWFEAVPNTLNTYNVRIWDQNSRYAAFLLLNHPVTFTTVDPTQLPVPNPAYLELHAAVCRIAHLCGAAEYLEEFERRADTTMVLASDGSAADVLAYRLSAVEIEVFTDLERVGTTKDSHYS